MAKKHNWTTTLKTIDRSDERAALAAICSCNHMTPATVDKMDRALGIGSSTSKVAPDPVVLDALNDDQGDWMDTATPPRSAYKR